jgi:hypothetical protein
MDGRMRGRNSPRSKSTIVYGINHEPVRLFPQRFLILSVSPDSSWEWFQQLSECHRQFTLFRQVRQAGWAVAGP